MTGTPLLLGHRGTGPRNSVPENSVAAFDLAIQHGCDGFEFDVRLTKDGRLVACHDPNVGRVTVAQADSHQLRDLAQLDEILKRYPHAFLDIELKVKGIGTLVLAALRDRRRTANCVISSFLPEVVMEVKARTGSIPVGIICENAAQLRRAHSLPVDYLMVEQSLLSPALLDSHHSLKRQVVVWTVNDRDSMLSFADLGVDGIISDDTQLLGSLWLRRKKLEPPT